MHLLEGIIRRKSKRVVRNLIKTSEDNATKCKLIRLLQIVKHALTLRLKIFSESPLFLKLFYEHLQKNLPHIDKADDSDVRKARHSARYTAQHTAITIKHYKSQPLHNAYNHFSTWHHFSTKADKYHIKITIKISRNNDNNIS